MTRIAPDGREGNSAPAVNGHVPTVRRFRGDHRCPICGGADDARRGQGDRCFGFLSGDGAYAHCTRDECAGGIPIKPGSQTYPHRLKGPCPCGKEHGPADPKPSQAKARRGGETTRGRIVATYDYRDADGTLLFQVVRYEPKGFVQRRPSGNGGWLWGLDGIEPVLYRLPELLAADPAQVVFVVEGEKDVDRLRDLGLVATCNPMGAGKWRDGYAAALQGRHVAVLLDNDRAGRDHARAGARSVAPRAAQAKVVDLPGLPPKGDVSDFLDAGGTADDLRRLVEQAPPWTPAAGRDRANDAPAAAEYLEAEAGLFLRRTIQGEGLTTRLANFTARIVRDVVRHEAGDIRRQVRIVATHAEGARASTVVDASLFAAMGWVEDGLGPKFAVTAGKGHRDHVRAAIQLLSVRDGFDAETVHTSLGWVEHHGRPLYLHAGGCIAQDGTCGDVRVEADAALGRYALPDPPGARHDVAGAIAAVRGLLDLGQAGRPAARHVAAILAALPWRAVLGPLDASVHFSGPTGTFKTTTALLALDHFAPGSGAGRVSVTWGATPNALQRHAYDCRDSLLVIDELTGETAVETATEFFQCQGNLKARARMTRDLRIAPGLDPRGTVLSTGEADPGRRSALGRMLTVRFTRDTVDVALLSRCQRDAAAGFYARAMAAYIRWLAEPGRLAATRAELRRLVDRIAGEIRGDPANRNVHPRHPAAVAELVAAYALFLRIPPNSRRVGYVDLKERVVHLDPELAKEVARTMGRAAGQPFEHAGNIARDLNEAGMIHISVEAGKVRLTVRNADPRRRERPVSGPPPGLPVW
jgi:hypothetical protein